VAYTAAYAVGAVLAFGILARMLGGLETPRLVRFLVRATMAAGIAAAVAWLVSLGVTELLGDERGKAAGVLFLALVASTHGLVFVGASRAMRVTEVTELVGWATSRIPGLR
jgi:putative peptidoglycan lipid II flippase